MYVVTVTFVTTPDASDAFREAVIAQAANSLNLEEACQRFDVCLDPEDPTRVFLYELYSDRAAFDLHLKSDHFLDFDARTRDWVTSKTVEIWMLD